MSAEQDLDKNESATPHKLDEARKRGQVAKSAELVSALVFACAVGLVYAKGHEQLLALFRFDRLLLGLAGDAQSAAHGAWWLWHLTEHCVRSAGTLLFPLLGGIVLVAILANLAQTGAVLSLHPVTPDWQRVNPATGLQRILSQRTMFDGVRALLKLGVLGTVLYYALGDLLPRAQRLTALTPLAQTNALVDDILSLAARVALALCVIALIDFGYTSREFARNMRMSRREVRDEFRNREGDPRIRSRLRELRRELLKRSVSVRRTAQADVVITNPTHVAVALRYKHGQMGAPVVLSKGVGGVAAAMRTIAARHRVPVVRSPALARALNTKSHVDCQIPPDLFADTARVMVWVMAMRGTSQATHQRGEAT